MKILHVISQAPDFTGSGKYIQAVISCADARGHENFLVAGIQGDFFLEPPLIAPGKTVYVRFGSHDLAYPLPGMSDVMPYESTRFSDLSQHQLAGYENAFASAIAEAIHRFRPDIIHSHHLWLVSCVARRVASGLPMVSTCHGTCLRQMSLCPHLAEKVTRGIREIDRVMALSQSQRQAISRMHCISRDRIQVVGGGYDQALFYCLDKPTGGLVEILYAGKLSESKGVPWLLRSLKQVRFRQWRLHLAGGGAGPEQKLCLDLAKEFGSRVVVHGPLSHQDLADLMRRSHLFVLPSFYEGLPLVLMEALASGCRVITTSLPGTMEILGQKPNAMVTVVTLPELETIDKPFEQDYPRLETALASALESVMETAFECPVPDLQEAADVSGRFAWQRVFDRIENTYAAALAEYKKNCESSVYQAAASDASDLEGSS